MNKNWLKITNIVLTVAMVLHVGISMYIRAQDVTNSAPAYVCLINAVFYLIPLVIINLSVWCANKYKSK